jgi:hypothetical protein
MPTAMVRPIILATEPSVRAARLIAEQFNVSLTAAAIRIQLETRDECFLVVSKDRRVQWWLSGSDRFGLWMESQQKLSLDSVAYHLTADATDPDKPEVVPTASWFLHLQAPECVETSEDSVRLGNTGFVLSMLVLGDAD